MALTIGIHQNALHDASSDALEALKTPRWQSGVGLTATPHFPSARTKAEEPVIPAPQVFQSLAESSIPSANAVPTVGECAAHLELLQAFHTLRVKVLQSTELDTTFGIKPNNRTVYRGGYYRQKRTAVKLKDNTFATRRGEKWPFFLGIAVARFRIWLKEAALDLMLRDQQRASSSYSAPAITFLPPLDVLMVWHSFLLNPKDFQEYCTTHDLRRICLAVFPWSSIHEAINADDWSYTVPVEAQLKSVAGLEPDLFEYLVNVGKTSTTTSSILSKYGSQDPADRAIDLKAVLKNINLADSKAAFLRSLKASRDDAALNQPIIEAVQRQVAFVDKMHAQLWIRSPVLEDTLQRAIDRYLKFLKLFKLYPKTMLVPTLDIDLVWHTHQCSAAQYRSAMLERAGRFINHDDKLGQSLLDDGMEKTRQLFRMRFGQEYLFCLCWDCEAALSAVDRKANDQYQDRTDMKEVAHEVFIDVAYHRAVELARRAGKSLPVRDR